jgi:hypothetical protein
MEQLSEKKFETDGKETIFDTINQFTARNLTNSPNPKVRFHCTLIRFFPLSYCLPPFIFQAPGIKDFCILKPISRGAFGKVFLGYKNTNPHHIFAIKVT